MESKLIKISLEEEKTIPFNKPGLYKLIGQEVYVLAPTQSVEESYKAYFAGTVIHTTSVDYPLGFHSEYFTKNAWVKVSQPVAIEFYD